MKKTMLTLSFIVAAYILKAQVLYGTTSTGGKNNSSAICKLVTATNTLTEAFSFEAEDGKRPQYTRLLQAADGKLYGMTYAGGAYNAGTIFSYDPAASAYTPLKSFDSTGGYHPYGSLVQASDGKLYGMTSDGGSINAGVIFSYDIATSTYIKLKDFDGTNGSNPYGSLLQASDGKLYGMTHGGGNDSAGVIFSYVIGTSTYTKLKDFDGTNGGNPYGSLLQASDGKLYGMTNGGGSDSAGVIFSYDIVTSTYTKLKDFDFANGAYPYGSLIQASDGKLYGMTYRGGTSNGVIFSYDIANSTYTKLKDLDYANGILPYGDLMQASDGKLNGMTSWGGYFDFIHGVIFSYDPVDSAYIRLIAFDEVPGGAPLGSLVQASDGKLYGMTSEGGIASYGVAFSYDPATSTYTKLKDFNTNNTGMYMHGALIKGQSNKCYGMTRSGGSYGAGTIFSYDATSSVFTKLQDFDYINGYSPYGSLVQASDGKLYGMTQLGGNFGIGTIFSYDPAISAYTKLKDFDYANGILPYGDLMQASDGKLYGMTYRGGDNNYGDIFSYDPATLIYQKLKDFNGTNGANPYGSLTQASDGKLYGMTSGGWKNNYGVIFSYDPVTLIYKKLKDFDGTNGANPYGSLIHASDGKLYGMTYAGESNDSGAIFSYDIGTSTYTKLKDLDLANGAYPQGSLMQASDGKLYGMTGGGGSNGYGVAFSYDPATSTYTKLSDFNGDNGSFPQYTSFVEIPSCITTTYHPDADGDGFGDADSSVQLCEPQDGYVTDSSDCNDSNAVVHPGAAEICNGIDDNCNGEIDEGCTAGEVRISILDKTVIEGNDDKKLIAVPITLSEKSEKIVRFNYTTQKNTATAGSDYIAQSGKLAFPPGVKKTILPIRIKGDETPEANETLRIILSDPVNATIADSTGIVTILDDDASAFNTAKEAAQTICTISLSPNPAQDKVKIMLTGYSGNVVIQLSSFDGRILQQQKLQTFSAKSAPQHMNVGSYANGTYLVTAIDEKGNRRAEKLVIRR